MALVEGLGDEVTVILGLLTIIIIILIAWLSTHTRDIPFFSVVVVELSQRVSRNQRASTPQGESSQEGETPSSDVSARSIGESDRSEISTVNSDLTEADDTQSSESVSDPSTPSETAPSPGIEDTSQAGSDSTEASVTTASNILNSSEPTQTDDSSCDAAEVPEESDKHSSTLWQKDVSDTTGTVTIQSESAPRVSSLGDSSVRHRHVPSSDSTPPTNSTPTPPSPTSTESEFVDSASDSHMGQIRIRLKYLNDTQRLVYSSPTDTIGQFRREHFSSELEANKLVRLIFNGQDMRNDRNTLQGYNITDNSVIHCLVTQNLQGTPPPHGDQGEGDVQIGAFMMPLFAIILAAIWYLRVTQRQYFNAVSTLSLAGVTFLFLLGCASLWRGGGGGNHGHQHVD